MSNILTGINNLVVRPKHVAYIASLLSLFTLVAYNIPLLRGVVESTEQEGEKSAEGEAVVAEEKTAAAII